MLALHLAYKYENVLFLMNSPKLSNLHYYYLSEIQQAIYNVHIVQQNQSLNY